MRIYWPDRREEHNELVFLGTINNNELDREILENNQAILRDLINKELESIHGDYLSLSTVLVIIISLIFMFCLILDNSQKNFCVKI